MRILYIFDAQRQAVLLVAGNKSGNWNRWYADAIKLAEDYHLAHMRKQQGMTQAQVATAIGVSQVRVSRMEHGDIEKMQSRIDRRLYVAAMPVVGRPGANFVWAGPCGARR